MDRIIAVGKRVSRLRYSALQLVNFSILVTTYPLAMKIGVDTLFGIVVMPLIFIIAFLYHLVLIFQRTMDIGGRWQWAFLAFIPFINFFYGIGLLFWKGSEGLNSYGNPPVQKHSYSIVLVILSIVLISYGMSIMPTGLTES
ncbi:DUF805 domain-containing protein [Motilimonas cestriensis]|uniref:DUF805 domain-containing protein n=1 Tax=Motilimonas cestriensis TaxID=2742685 RepID=A0ABS8WGT6_9GAMM|nr:DUF805 domain-containing protein [Motilimonas cestriensis]MCE2597417.1 DUF805 domain-containing protein [Motilimonas cestriensis]